MRILPCRYAWNCACLEALATIKDVELALIVEITMSMCNRAMIKDTKACPTIFR